MQEIQTASGQWAVPEHRGQHKAAALEAKNSSQNLNMFYYAALQREHDLTYMTMTIYEQA